MNLIKIRSVLLDLWSEHHHPKDDKCNVCAIFIEHGFEIQNSPPVRKLIWPEDCTEMAEMRD